MLRYYRYRINPTDEQKIMLAKTFGCCRVAYNWALELRENIWKETGKSISQYEMAKRVRKDLCGVSAPWMKEVSSKAVEFAIEDLYRGYEMFFKKQSRKPKFRSKHGRQHYHDRGSIKVDFRRGLITIPKIADIPCVFHRRFVGCIKQVSVELLTTGCYYVCVLVDNGLSLPEKKPIDPDNALGIDTGLEHFAVLSDGQKFNTPHYAKKEAQKMKLLERRFAKKQKDSRQYRILKRRLARLNEKIKNRRHDYINKITHYLAYENQATTICVEDLNLEEMKHVKHIAYSIRDSALGVFYQQLEYKCAWAGKNYIKIDRFAPSSRMCSHCGYVNKEWSMQIRDWTCPVCGIHHGRDINAAINIKNIGLGLNKTLPLVRREVTPAEQPLVDDRS